MNTTTTDSPIRRTQLKWFIFAACGVSLLIGYQMMPTDLSGPDQAGYMLRVTARIAFVFLLLAYVARPLVQLFGVGQSLVRNRRFLGLSMAIAHTIHFGYVYQLIVQYDMPAELITLVFGGLAFALMWLMAATSNDVSMRYLGRNWKRLHTFGIHYLWLIFMQSFIPRALGMGEVVEGMQPLYVVLSALGFLALALRVGAFVRRRQAAVSVRTT